VRGEPLPGEGRIRSPEREGGREGFPLCRDAASLAAKKAKGVIDRAGEEDTGLFPVSIDDGNGIDIPLMKAGGGCEERRIGLHFWLNYRRTDESG